jgi:hypothetical protein
MEVAGTPFDFREFKTIGRDITADHQQIKNGNGYDHSFIINGQPGDLRPACIVREPVSGRSLEVWTTEPAIQFYTANFLDGTITGKDQTVYEKREAVFVWRPSISRILQIIRNFRLQYWIPAMNSSSRQYINSGNRTILQLVREKD